MQHPNYTGITFADVLEQNNFIFDANSSAPFDGTVEASMRVSTLAWWSHCNIIVILLPVI